MCASGSKITSQFLLGNKRLSMHTSKHLHLPGACFQWRKMFVRVQDKKLALNEFTLWPSKSFASRFVKKKFEELYFQSTSPDRVDRVFKIYRTTALDQKLVKKTFKLVDETLRRRNLFEAGLLWPRKRIIPRRIIYLFIQNRDL